LAVKCKYKKLRGLDPYRMTNFVEILEWGKIDAERQYEYSLRLLYIDRN
jgi:hypothetical protein